MTLPARLPIIEVRAVHRDYVSGGAVFAALDGLDLRVRKGEMLAVTGPSGSGKTTLLNLIAGLDRPTSGSVVVLGLRLESANEGSLGTFRARHVGLMFQEPNLLPGLSAIENLIAARLPWGRWRELETRGRSLLAELGLADRADAPPARMSGGERQRVGLARALMGEPDLLLCDEPTGNLDLATTEQLLALLETICADRDLTTVVCTHDPAVAASADRMVRLSRGKIVDERRLDHAGPLDVRRLNDG